MSEQNIEDGQVGGHPIRFMLVQADIRNGSMYFEFSQRLQFRGSDVTQYLNKWSATDAPNERDHPILTSIIGELFGDDTSGVEAIASRPYRLVLTVTRLADIEHITGLVRAGIEAAGYQAELVTL